MTIKKISVMAAALVAVAALVTGCSPSVENNGGSGTENTAEKRMYYGTVAEPSGMLTVTVQGEKASALFKSEGKEYQGEGAVASDGAVALELTSEADSQNKYSFSGSYDGEKKVFTKGQFGKAGLALKDVELSSEKGSKVWPFYYGKVYPTGLYEYEVTITKKSESAVAVLFAREVTQGDTVLEIGSDKVYVQVEGRLSGKNVEAKVRLEGEEFIFKTVLHDDGFLRETKLLGERGFTGERAPTRIYEYEAKGLKAQLKDAASSFTGDLTVTMHLSQDVYEEADRLEKAGKGSGHDKVVVGEMFVTFHELTEKNRTRMYKGRKALTKKDYEKGFDINLYNLLDRKSLVGEASGTMEKPGYIEHDSVAPAYVLVVKAKGWYDNKKHEFKGVRFGRAKSKGAIVGGKGYDVSEKLKYVQVK